MWPFYYEPTGISVLEEAQQLLQRDVLPSDSQCSPTCRKRSLPDRQTIWPRSGSVCVYGVAERLMSNNTSLLILNSGWPEVCYGNLHASVKSKRYRQILQLKNHHGNRQAVRNHTASVRKLFDGR